MKLVSKDTFRGIVLAFLLRLSVVFAAPLQSAPLRHGGGECAVCPPGLGVLTKCNATHDTTCELCPRGSYSEHNSSVEPCYACSKCGQGLYEYHPCNRYHDVFCELCNGKHKVRNKDYMKHCGIVYPKDNDPMDRMMGDMPMVDPESEKSKTDKQNKTPKELDKNKDKKKVIAKIVSSSPATHGDLLTTVEDTNTTHAHSNLSVAKTVSVGNLKKESILKSYKENKTTKNKTLFQPTSAPDESTTHINTPVPSTADIQDGVGFTKDGSTDSVEITHAPTSPNMTQTPTIDIYIHGSSSTKKPRRKSKNITAVKLEIVTKKVTRHHMGMDKKDVTRTQEAVDPKHRKSESVHGETFREEPIIQATTSKQASHGISPFAIIISTVTSAIVFFSLGFFLNRVGTKKGIFSSKKPARLQAYDPAPVEDSDAHRTLLDQVSPGLVKNVIELKPIPNIHDLAASYNKREMTYTDPGIVTETENDVADDEDDDHSPTTVANHTEIGKFQSPIDLGGRYTDVDKILLDHPLVIKYFPENSRSITNTGNSVQVDIQGDSSVLRGGPLLHRHQVSHLLIHYGEKSGIGSEHSVDGRFTSAELHIVHFNADLYDSYAEAMAAEDGLAVLAVFVNEGKENLELNKWVDALPSIPRQGQSCHLPDGFDITRVLPENRQDYWTYQGSLTTTPYYETVTWLVFKEPIEMSTDQLTSLRGFFLLGEDSCHSDDLAFTRNPANYRLTQPREERRIRATFD